MAIIRFTVTVYARHSASCPRHQDPYWRRCRCPKWLYVNQDGERSQRSAKTRSWERADEVRRDIEREFELLALRPNGNGNEPLKTLAALGPTDNRVTVSEAVEKFLAAKKKENLADDTIDKLRRIFEKGMLTWAASEKIAHLERIGLAELERFRDTWKDAPLARKKKQERAIGFFYYCVRRGWIKTNPATLLGRIKVRENPTDYFNKEEFEKILQATYVYNPKAWNTEPRNQATRARVLILLMRWSGLSIRDAVKLERSNLSENDELFLYRAKTGNPVFVPLPPDVAQALREIPAGIKSNPRYFFWTGHGKLKSAVGNWQRTLRRVFKLADIRHADGTKKRCHPHMFRDTFAVECLLSGMLLDEVSILLAHKSVKITEKHYAPWVRARQEQLSSNVRRSWLQGTQAKATKPSSLPCKAVSKPLTVTAKAASRQGHATTSAPANRVNWRGGATGAAQSAFL